MSWRCILIDFCQVLHCLKETKTVVLDTLNSVSAGQAYTNLFFAFFYANFLLNLELQTNSLLTVVQATVNQRTVEAALAWRYSYLSKGIFSKTNVDAMVPSPEGPGEQKHLHFENLQQLFLMRGRIRDQKEPFSFPPVSQSSLNIHKKLGMVTFWSHALLCRESLDLCLCIKSAILVIIILAHTFLHR